ncbi:MULTISPECIES: ABC transporter permease [unclassified Sphingomonas]|uniref:ABC transporter permease n=1 Tax=unclassified Sphingomonas TaxID=196159 RepID=UPI001621AEDC|nr:MULTISPECIES: ABC transporter permease [unclassified Sphingomonas]MBB3346917.1 ABC-2 type transport system permease protein [Sphingomonas sp. BK069]MBB3471754.1 ABC-2 type transport system permease protein [Sphingomonas sp. BK345]
MNLHGIWAIYRFEMARFGRTIWTSLATPVITTTLYFIVFGSAIGSQMRSIGDVPYGAFIVPGLMLLTIFSESVFNASLGIYMPKFTGTIYELLSAPLSAVETVIGYVGAAATKSMVIGLVIFATAHLFVDLHVAHPLLMLGYLLLVAASFSLFGFCLGIWANGFEQLQIIPLLVITPLTFLGGAFYSLSVLPEPWRTVSLFNPIAYLINGFRWTFFGISDVDVLACVAVTAGFGALCLAAVVTIFHTGWRLKS